MCSKGIKIHLRASVSLKNFPGCTPDPVLKRREGKGKRRVGVEGRDGKKGKMEVKGRERRGGRKREDGEGPGPHCL